MARKLAQQETVSGRRPLVRLQLAQEGQQKPREQEKPLVEQLLRQPCLAHGSQAACSLQKLLKLQLLGSSLNLAEQLIQVD